MRIGFDAKRLYNNLTGLGNYSRTVVGNLSKYYPQNEYFLYTTKVTDSQETKTFLSDKFITRRSKAVSKALWRSFSVVKELKKDKIELYHGLSNEIPFNIRKSGIKSVVTIHDLIFKVYPKHYKRFDRTVYDRKFRYSCEKSDKIIAISEHTKKDIVKYYKIDASKIEVIYQPCAPLFYEESRLPNKEVLKKHKLPEKYLLYVGSVSERKNLKTIIEAYLLIPSEIRIPLVIVGSGGKYMSQSKTLIKKLKLEKFFIWLEELSNNQQLKIIYQNAAAFIYPSLYEGFGIPIAEALLCKTPVITSNTSAMPEAGGPDSIYIDPLNERQMAEAIELVLTDASLRKKMTENGYKYAREKFDAEKCTHQLMQCYRICLP